MTSFFIATPAFNGLRWLPACVASVAAQAGPAVRVHHHVQDGGSTDGTAEWLEEYKRKVESGKLKVERGEDEGESTKEKVESDGDEEGNVKGGVESEKWKAEHPGYSFSYASVADQGMYDAINRAWERANDTWQWLAYLNCDEQYQPEALLRMAACGETQPERGALTANCIVVDVHGDYLCSRKPSIGWPWVGRIWIPAFTCAFFLRREFFTGRGVRFKTDWKSFGDKVFCRDLLDLGCRFGYCDEYVSVFIHRGDNLGLQPISEVERSRYWEEGLSLWARRSAPLAILAARVSRWVRCWFGRRPAAYRFVGGDGSSRLVEVQRNRWAMPLKTVCDDLHHR